MVYAGYVPAKLPTVATDLDRAVMAVTNMDSLEIIGKLLYNAAVQPKEEKYRRIRLTNEKIRATIADVPTAMELLLQLGWVKEEAEEAALVIPAGKFMSMREVRMIEEQKERVRKDARKAEVAALRGASGSVAV
eukprot:CAMPEP_0202865176 /NCGR_PEP_ID=MMETSP1391-20130828/5316_1 /ASSEMBLY_ACC=CAM_ASM_000867 /TAXON_ID=1034604 /ORGANISM="Chlamydomonas leiostraca, Strain SAG 11-49" /LENGTH=133 /DNA_ID=CAMNT_0049544981 /DNA_START=108 /DNA_END=509 /DNA_ORIENTATION=+